MPSKPHQERERDIRVRWERQPDGAILQRNEGPPGLRAPNGFVWGHQLGDIFWMPRIPGTNVLTVWSRTMLKQLGEGYNDSQWDEPIVEPRILRPWPLLTLAKEGQHADNSTFNDADKGCNYEHPSIVCRPPPGYHQDPSMAMHPALLALLGECPYDPEMICTGPLVSNIGSERAKNAHGEFYDYIWCDHFKAKLLDIDDPRHIFGVVQRLYPNGLSGSEEKKPFVVPDNTGVCMYIPGDAVVDANSKDHRDATPGPAASQATQSIENAPTAVVSPVTEATSGSGDDTAGGTAADATAPGALHEAKDTDEGPTSSNPPLSADGEEPPQSSEELTPARDLYKVDDLPKLEEFIPKKHFPNVLMVHDPDNLTQSRKGDKSSGQDEPLKYKLFYPQLAEEESASKDDEVAHLYLRRANRFGTGNHSYVYRAPLTLPPPLSARSPTGQVTVAAKLSQNRCTAHELLHNEAQVYNALPEHAQEEWCGYNVVPQCRFPVPVGAIAPKFFGYYLPVDSNGKPLEKRHPNCSEEGPHIVDWASPILLMEECGSPVEPSKFTPDQRTECFSLMLRLHHLDIVQGSFYVRNIMCQPGPLTCPPEERSYDHPSFRIIDFGRGKCWDWEMKKSRDREKARYEFAQRIGDEVARARKELLIGDFAF